ncbi:hypothetical protein PF003_g38055 [Phytophthora fragariae]|nr:hypothetical protein PF003_g38055 [Phytophthora fragariae]
MPWGVPLGFPHEGAPRWYAPNGPRRSANRMGCTAQGRSHVATPAGSRFHRFDHLPPPFHHPILLTTLL